MATLEKVKLNMTVRVVGTLLFMGTLFAIIIVRLWYLQVIQGEHFRIRSENNLTRRVFVPPPRGIIRDRFDRVIVKNRPSFNVDLVVEDSPNPKQTLNKLAEIIGGDGAEFYKSIQHQKKRRRFEPKLILKDITRDQVAKVLARSYELPGVIISVNPARDYVYKDVAAHVLGYIGEISRPQLDSPTYSGYRLGDIIGQYGIESKWESDLQGARGVQAVIVNASGTRIGESSFESESPGRNLTLTLNLDVQKAADEALKDVRGAIVALEPFSGEVLALASSPRFDPNNFVKGISPEDWDQLRSGEYKPLNNRAVQGTYPPGSVFKAIMAVAGLAEGVITPSTKVRCSGAIYVGRRAFHCHKREGHGSLSLKGAIQKSCDVYFYTVGNRLGIDRIHNYASQFGLGKITNLILTDEKPGIVPSTEWKKRYFKRPEDQRWYPGETPSVAIGQGALTATPLQMARVMAALVNGGNVLRPYLVKRVDSSDGQYEDYSFGPQILSQVQVEKKHLLEVQKGLLAVVNEQGGTGRRARIAEEFGVTVAGKTGTSQVVALDKDLDDERFNHHAWFAGYAPAEKPEIVVSAIIENGGQGGLVAAPVVSKIIEAYFVAKQKSKSKQKKISGPVAFNSQFSGVG